VNPCSRCSTIAAAACARTDAGGRVLVYAPAPPAFGKAKSAATGAGYHVETLAESVLLLNGPSGDWSSLLAGLESRLSTVEADETRIAAIGGLPVGGQEIALAALQARTVPMLLGELRDAWLPRALEAGRLTSYFQPIVDVETGVISAHEALIRAYGENGSIVNGGQIVEAGRRLGALHVLDQVGRTSAIRCAAGLGLTTNVFINFFPTVVYDPVHCLRTTREAMRDTGLQPEQIVFEVVESEQIADRYHLLDILAYYRGEGFRVALDDLGSGYSSLNLLVALRPDFVKLDMELARDVTSDPLSRALVEALVRTALENGIQVVAEGVETIECARVLHQMGITLLQGYLFGRPSPAAGRLDLGTLAAVRKPA
jgi:EAL domain-containing protein (putative c-di-GMP-specific phosphodiesterase class I)